MEFAILHHSIVELERERAALVRQGSTLEAAREQLEEKYRIYSREKGAFRCACCSSRVVMVLYADRALFRHYDNEACSGERNYTTYVAGRARLKELAVKHAEGKEVIRQHLLELQGEGYTFEEGYLYKKELRYVPDFLLQMENGERWAIDYVVSLKGDAAYRRRLRARLACYQAHGFKPLCLLDRSWLAVTDSAYLAFNHAELSMRAPENPYDQLWQRELSLAPLNLQEKVYSLLYLDVQEEMAYLARFQMGGGDRWGRLLFEPWGLPLYHLLAVDRQWLDMTGEAMLQLFRPREPSAVRDYCARLIQLLQEEEQQKAEQQARASALEARISQLRAASLAAEESKRNVPDGMDGTDGSLEPGLKPELESGSESESGERGLMAIEKQQSQGVAVSAQFAELLTLLDRCLQSPRRADYPGLEANLARAQALAEKVTEGGEDAEQCYKSAWSVLRNISYPLLGE